MTHEHPVETSSEHRIRRLAAELFILGYPLVLMDAVRRAHPPDANRFLRLAECGERLAPGLDAEDPRVVRASAWLDLSVGPVVLALPDLGGRYGALTLIDAWGEVFATAGSRTYTDAGYDLAVVGPEWRGELPAGLAARRARTNVVWAISRIAAHDEADRAAVEDLFSRHCVLPLFGSGGALRPNGVAVAPPAQCVADAVASLGPAAFFARLTALVRRHPLRPGEREMLRALQRLERETTFPGAGAEAAAKGLRDGRALLRNAMSSDPSETPSPWRPIAERPHDSALARACGAYRHLGAAPRPEILHLVCDADEQGRRLDGSACYSLHFPPGAAPPARAFWSLAVLPGLDAADRLLWRPSFGERDHPRFNDDGSFDIFIQHAPPRAGRAANWLPIPERALRLSLRLYWPRSEAIDGRWSMPAPMRVDDLEALDGAPRGLGACPTAYQVNS